MRRIVEFYAQLAEEPGAHGAIEKHYVERIEYVHDGEGVDDTGWEEQAILQGVSILAG
jgi:hypothetical protein